MNIQRKQIEDYILKNPSSIDRSQPNPYGKVAQKFKTDIENIRSIHRGLRRKGLITDEQITNYATVKECFVKPSLTFTSTTTGDFSEIRKETTTSVKTLDDLIEVCDIDTDQWEVSSWECKAYEAWIKKDGEIHAQPKYSIYAKLKKRKVEEDVTLQKNVILQELRDFVSTPIPVKEYKHNGGLLLELALFDPHFGKLAHKDESGADYDLKIAGECYRNAIGDLLSKIDLNSVGRILFPIGNDLFNVDNMSKMTFNGTPQDTDTRFHKMVKYVKNLLIEVIDHLSTIAPVDVVVVPGNHDTSVTFLAGEVLDAYYHNNENIQIYNSAKLRKYYVFGENAFLFTHGDREKQNELGMIFAAEEPKIWGNSTYRFCQIGHYHHTKKINFLFANEFQGFQIQILPSLSPADAWHAGKGYMALRQAKAFLFDPNKGLVAELTYTV